MLERILNKATAKALREVLDRQASKKADETWKEEEKSWTSEYHCILSGYYTGILMDKLGMGCAAFFFVCAILTLLSGLLLFGFFFIILGMVMLWCRKKSRDNMRQFIYGESFFVVQDREGNELDLLPFSIISKVKFTLSYIEVTAGQKVYKIIRHHSDNQKQTEEFENFIKTRFPEKYAGK